MCHLYEHAHENFQLRKFYWFFLLILIPLLYYFIDIVADIIEIVFDIVATYFGMIVDVVYDFDSNIVVDIINSNINFSPVFYST